MGSITDGLYEPDDGSLPAVQITNLYEGKAALTRQPSKQEFIQSLWPIFSGDKVSFTRKDLISIMVNDKKVTCNQAIHFINKPKTLKINDDNIWQHTDSHPNTFFCKHWIGNLRIGPNKSPHKNVVH